MNLLAAENTVQSDLLSELLFGLAQPVPGSRLDDEELTRVALETFLDRPFCIVRRWMLIDVMLSANREKAVLAGGVAPRVLFANDVIYAQPLNHPTPKGLVSSFETQYEDCFFETQDMLYILAGQGGQRYASAPAVAALSQWLGQDNLRDLV